jgi:hypothetical protein
LRKSSAFSFSLPPSPSLSRYGRSPSPAFSSCPIQIAYNTK